jgi:AdoMet-dependent rRNA methyltransferase SPB1
VIGQKKPEVKYVVSKKSQRGGRPAGTKGPYKVVDKRLKKDKRAAKNRSKKQSNNKGRKSGKNNNNNRKNRK